MKAKIVFKNYLCLLLIVVFGIVGPLNNIAGAKSSGSDFSNSVAAYSVRTIQVVEVANTAPNHTMVSVANSENASGAVGCMTAKFYGDNSVQGQSIMNLNQPASCFRLVAGFSNSTQKVSVTTVSLIKSMVVVATWPVQTIVSFRLNSAPAQPVPSIPTQAYVFIVVVLAGFGVKKLARKINQKSSFVNMQNFGLLMVMRC